MFIEFLKKMVAIPSITGNQFACKNCLDLCIDFLGETGLIVQKQFYNGVPSALISNTKEVNLDVLFLCHLDVVPASEDLFHLIQQGDFLFGRGVQDMKGPTTAALFALKEFFKIPSKAKIGILLVCDEETGGQNGTAIWANKLNPTVVLEPDSAVPINKIIEKAKQPVFIELTAQGKSAHGSRPWLGIDAVQELLMTLNTLYQTGNFTYYSEGGKQPENQGWINTLHIGKIQGGEAMNAIAEKASALLDFRLVENQNEKTVMDLIQHIKSPYVNVKILSVGQKVKTDLNHPIAKLYTEIVEKIIQKPLEKTNAFGATDGRYFQGKSLVLTHQATGEGAHSIQEKVSLKSLDELKNIYTAFLKEF